MIVIIGEARIIIKALILLPNSGDDIGNNWGEGRGGWMRAGARQPQIPSWVMSVAKRETSWLTDDIFWMCLISFCE